MNSDIRVWDYRHYVANSLKWSVEGRFYESTLYELMNPAPIDNRSAEEITQEVVNKTGITIID